MNFPAPGGTRLLADRGTQADVGGEAESSRALSTAGRSLGVAAPAGAGGGPENETTLGADPGSPQSRMRTELDADRHRARTRIPPLAADGGRSGRMSSSLGPMSESG